MVHKTKELVKKLPIIKPHLDLLAAILTIPVLITVIILNFSNLAGKKATITPTPSPEISTKVEYRTVTTAPHYTNSNPNPTDSPTCKQDIGPISISDPSEGEKVTANPVCIGIDYQGNGYCSVVWAYRVNGGPLSDYSNNSVCLYNMPPGNVTFELDVKSLVSSNTRVITRTFQYSPPVTPTATPTPTVTISTTPTVNP
ncbi:MAG TPA: hypothetical protein VF189_04895 [Patescibacteria group bacterium]